MRVKANPKYRQLKEIVKEQINKGKLKPGDRISAEGKIAERYGVSLGTVRQAMAELVNEGLIYKEQGKWMGWLYLFIQSERIRWAVLPKM